MRFEYLLFDPRSLFDNDMGNEERILALMTALNALGSARWDIVPIDRMFGAIVLKRELLDTEPDQPISS